MKMVILWLSCLLLSVSLVACGHGWKHSQVPAAKWDADYLDYVHRAESTAKNYHLAKDPAQNPGAFGAVQYFTDKCMEKKGYTRAADSK